MLKNRGIRECHTRTGARTQVFRLTPSALLDPPQVIKYYIYYNCWRVTLLKRFTIKHLLCTHTYMHTLWESNHTPFQSSKNHLSRSMSYFAIRIRSNCGKTQRRRESRRTSLRLYIGIRTSLRRQKKHTSKSVYRQLLVRQNRNTHCSKYKTKFL